MVNPRKSFGYLRWEWERLTPAAPPRPLPAEVTAALELAAKREALPKWEEVGQDMERQPCPGGWIYRVNGKYPVFVPDGGSK